MFLVGGNKIWRGGVELQKNMTGGPRKNKMYGGGIRKKKMCGGCPSFFPVRPPLRISNGIALRILARYEAKIAKIYILPCNSAN